MEDYDYYDEDDGGGMEDDEQIEEEFSDPDIEGEEVEVALRPESSGPCLKPNKVRVTLPIMNKFEFTRLLGIRATQLQMPDYQPIIDVGTEHDVLKIARMELLAGTLPLIVRRHLPDGTCEDWKASELKIMPQLLW